MPTPLPFTDQAEIDALEPLPPPAYTLVPSPTHSRRVQKRKEVRFALPDEDLKTTRHGEREADNLGEDGHERNPGEEIKSLTGVSEQEMLMPEEDRPDKSQPIKGSKPETPSESFSPTQPPPIHNGSNPASPASSPSPLPRPSSFQLPQPINPTLSPLPDPPLLALEGRLSPVDLLPAFQIFASALAQATYVNILQSYHPEWPDERFDAVFLFVIVQLLLAGVMGVWRVYRFVRCPFRTERDKRVLVVSQLVAMMCVLGGFGILVMVI